jgi:hypothetical protein
MKKLIATIFFYVPFYLTSMEKYDEVAITYVKEFNSTCSLCALIKELFPTSEVECFHKNEHEKVKHHTDTKSVAITNIVKKAKKTKKTRRYKIKFGCLHCKKELPDVNMKNIKLEELYSHLKTIHFISIDHPDTSTCNLCQHKIITSQKKEHIQQHISQIMEGKSKYFEKNR